MTTVSRPENSPQNPSVALDEPGFSIIGASSQSPASASAAVSPEPVVAISSADWHKDGEVPANGTPAAANEDDKRDHALEEGFRTSESKINPLHVLSQSQTIHAAALLPLPSQPRSILTRSPPSHPPPTEVHIHKVSSKAGVVLMPGPPETLLEEGTRRVTKKIKGVFGASPAESVGAAATNGDQGGPVATADVASGRVVAPVFGVGGAHTPGVSAAAAPIGASSTSRSGGGDFLQPKFGPPPSPPPSDEGLPHTSDEGSSESSSRTSSAASSPSSEHAPTTNTIAPDIPSVAVAAASSSPPSAQTASPLPSLPPSNDLSPPLQTPTPRSAPVTSSMTSPPSAYFFAQPVLSDSPPPVDPSGAARSAVTTATADDEEEVDADDLPPLPSLTELGARRASLSSGPSVSSRRVVSPGADHLSDTERMGFTAQGEPAPTSRAGAASPSGSSVTSSVAGYFDTPPVGPHSTTGSIPADQQQLAPPTLLHPSSASPPTRRASTTSSGAATLRPTAITRALSQPLIAAPQAMSHHQSRQQTAVPGLDDSALDSDILEYAASIKRERLAARARRLAAEEAAAKQAAGGPGTGEGEVGIADEAHTRHHHHHLHLPHRHHHEDPLQEQHQAPASAHREAHESSTTQQQQVEEAKVLVGNLIGEDHVNYVLMYNMLTGIRIGVSRCQAKIGRPLTDEDFVARHKFSFDIVGNELTPSAKYDFKFKDYAPWVFRDLRDTHFRLDAADYLLSLTAKYILSELGSPGKSGSFFYFSRDYRYIIKTISHTEHKFLRSILKDYHEHVKSNPHTLLSRFYGLHRVKLPRGRKIHFVIMNNLFPPHRDIHETYDLKGSSVGREYPEEKAKLKKGAAVLKDINWVRRGRQLELGPEKGALLGEQLRRDAEFLKRMKIMDYSLLVGIHNMERGNRDGIRQANLQLFEPNVNPTPRRKPSSVKASADAQALRTAVQRSDPRSLGRAGEEPRGLSEDDTADRKHFLFYQDEGGLRATDQSNAPLDTIYYLGVIDICTPYSCVKKIEHMWKSFTEDRHGISAVEPKEYADRFLNFLLSVMPKANPALRPHGLRPEDVKPFPSQQEDEMKHEHVREKEPKKRFQGAGAEE